MSLSRAQKTSFSTLRDEFLDAPAATYPGLRQGPPVAWSDEEGGWVVHRHADVAAAMKDPRLAVTELAQSVRVLGGRGGKDVEALAAVIDEVLFLRNPPAHGAGRQFLVAVLNERPLSVHQGRIEEIARRLLKGARPGAAWDAATAYADLIPPLFTASLLGLEDAEVLDAMSTVTEATKALDRGRSLRFYERVNKTVETAREPFRAAVRRRRAAPAEDGLSRMIALSDARFGLTDEVIANRALFLLIGGVETTSALIGSTIAAVAERPDIAARIRAAPALAAAAVEETLRFDGPVKQTSRIALSDFEIAGQPIKMGERVLLLVGAAHRDAAVFPEPDRFDIDRPVEGILGFGAGLHFCIGAALARLEARVGLREILAAGELSLETEGRSWLRHRTLRRLEHLPVIINQDRKGEQ